MSRVRFQLLFGSPSTHPHRMNWPVLGDEDTTRADPEASDWYGWRLMGANNRELGRSAHSFASYPGARQAIRLLQQQTDRPIRATVIDPATGRWVGDWSSTTGRWR